MVISPPLLPILADLHAQGVGIEKLLAVHAPIGLEIGGELDQHDGGALAQ